MWLMQACFDWSVHNRDPTRASRDWTLRNRVVGLHLTLNIENRIVVAAVFLQLFSAVCLFRLLTWLLWPERVKGSVV